VARWLGRAAVVAAGLMLASCRLIATADVPGLANANAPTGSGAFDPDKMAASMWSTKIVPYFEMKAGVFEQVHDLVAKSPDEAGSKFGFRAKSEDTPWTLMVKLDGVIVSADTESRASTISVGATSQNKPVATVQIGPAIRGTAIRDALDFVSFGDFTNQIDFARFGKALNTYVNHSTLEKLPRDDLLGRKVSVVGAYPLMSSPETPVITPVEITVGPKS
jgi:predicted lipoprotein